MLIRAHDSLLPTAAALMLVCLMLVGLAGCGGRDVDAGSTGYQPPESARNESSAQEPFPQEQESFSKESARQAAQTHHSLRPTLSSTDHWPRLLGNHFESAAPLNPNVRIDWSTAPETAWSISVGDGYGVGSVASGRYFHFDAIDDPEVRDAIRERLRAFRWDTGDLVWSQELPTGYRDLYGYESGPRSVPTIDGDDVFTMGVAGDLVCRRVADGSVRWSVDTAERFGVVQNFFGVGGSPLVVGDLVIVMVGGSPAADQAIPPGQLDRVSPAGSLLVAVDRHTGQTRWQCGDDLASYSSPRTIELGDETFVLMFGRDALWMIDPDGGQVLWKHPHRADMLESVNAMVPVVRGQEILISECYQVGSVLLRTGLPPWQGEQRVPEVAWAPEVVWQDPARDRRRQSLRCHWSTPVVIDGFVYGCSGRNAPDCDFRCVEWSTGKVRWTGMPRRRSSVTQVNDHLVVWDERARMTVLKVDPDELKVVSEWPLDGSTELLPGLNYPCWSAPVVLGQRMLLRGDETVICLQLAAETGEKPAQP